MADVHSKEVRSYNMSRIKGWDTKPEILIRKFLFSNGLRYRLYVKNLPGKPDLVFKKYKTVVFLHGCFWHGHQDCKYFSIPQTRTNWWLEKINRNRRRDSENLSLLRMDGWKVCIIWECELKSDKKDLTLKSLLRKIKSVK